MKPSRAAELERIVRSTPWLVDALRAVREVDPPDWMVGAGAVRTAVWDRLHGYEPSTPTDVDVAFFDAADVTPTLEAEIERRLGDLCPGLRWDAKNQAAVHLWYADKFGYEVGPLASTADAIATWPETATCVGLRLEQDDSLTVLAPYGLADLLGLVHRRNPARVSPDEYERRLREKRIVERWPRVRVARPG